MKNYKYHYTRYVDDLTISGGTEIAFLIHAYFAAIEKHGFKANPKKLRVGRPSNRQKVPGVIVNQKLNAPKKLIRHVRQQLFYCNKLGVENHCEKIGIIPEHFLSESRGMIGYIRMTNPALADEFSLQLHGARTKSFPREMSEEAKTMLALRDAMERGRIVTFTCENTVCRAAPSEMWTDEYGALLIKCFQLSPQNGWRVFEISAITNITIEDPLL